MRPLRHANIAGLAETGNSCPGFSDAATSEPGKRNPVRIPIDRPLEDSRQPASHLVSARRISYVGCWVGFCLRLLPGYGRDLFSRRLRFPLCCHFSSGSSRVEKAFPCEAIFAACSATWRSAHVQIGLTLTFLAYQAWLMADAILRTLGRLFITRQEFAGMGDRGAVQVFGGIQITRDLSSAWPAALCWPLVCDRGSRSCGTTTLGPLRLRFSFSGPRLPPWRSGSAVPPQPPGDKSVVPGRRSGSPPDFAPHLALLRNICFPGGPRAPSRQFSGNAQTRCRPPNFADEYRALSSFHGLRAGLRMAGHAGNRRAPGSYAGDHGPDGIVPRTFLQLV